MHTLGGEALALVHGVPERCPGQLGATLRLKVAGLLPGEVGGELRGASLDLEPVE
jgi:hypothetical protein